jgi:hypothetical protein
MRLRNDFQQLIKLYQENKAGQVRREQRKETKSKTKLLSFEILG